jgi:hypothetical protein
MRDEDPDDGLIDYRLGTPEEISEAEAALEAAEASGDNVGYAVNFFRLAALLPPEAMTITVSTERRPFRPGCFRRWPSEFSAGRFASHPGVAARCGPRYFPNYHSDRFDD